MFKRLVVFSAVFALVALIFCLGNAQVPTNPKVVAEPLIVEPGKQGGILRLVGDRPNSLNPYVDDDFNKIMHAVLLEVNPLNYSFEPGLAESFEWAPDGRALTLTLRNIKFSDGTPFTVEDVLFTINDVLLNMEIQSDMLSGLRRKLFMGGSQMVLKNAEKLDARRVRLNLNMPFGSLLRFPLPQLPILPRHKLADKVKKLNPNAAPDAFVKAWGLGAKPEDFAGSGPFKIKTLHTNKIVFERNPFYWKVDKNKVQLPYVNTFEFSFVQDPKELLGKIRDGEVDIFKFSVDFVNTKIKDASELFSAIEKAGMRFAYRDRGFENTMLSINQDATDEALRKVFRDLRFRKAIAHLIDRGRLVKEALAGFGVPQDTFISPFSPYFDRQANARFDFSIERAKNLLDELGLKDTNGDGIRELPNGKPLQIELLITETNEARVNTAKIIAPIFAEAGINLVTATAPGQQVSQRINKRPPEYQFLIISILGSAISPEDFFAFYHSTGPFHFYKFSDAAGKDVPHYQKRVDEILVQLTIERDEAKRRALAVEFQKLTSENLPVIWLFSPGFYLVAKPNIGNTSALTTLDAAASLGLLEVLWLRSSF
jgi:peptide/nickel transport system substrate-binding protein